LQLKHIDNFETWVSMTNQGKLSIKLNPRYVLVFNELALVGQYKPMSQINQISKYLFIAILCANISSVYKTFKAYLNDDHQTDLIIIEIDP